MTPDGGDAVLLVDKPTGPTSHDIVTAARRSTGQRRIGHTGTLDPFASGLLILCLGRATRLSALFHLLPKRYAAELRLGEETTTDDRTGETRATSGAWRDLGRDDAEAALRRWTGRREQVPPVFSAKKVEGRRAHRLAREGRPPDLPAVSIVVHRLELTAWEPPVAAIDAWVSTGTFVRALVRDVGRDLGCGAHLAELRRTAIGPFDVAAACRPDDAAAAGASKLPPLEALAWLPRRALDAAEREAVGHGRPVAAAGVLPPARQDFPFGPSGELPVVLADGDRLAAMARRDADRLRPFTVFHAA